MVPSDTGRPLAVITGASAGLGREFAVQLAQRGHDLALVARDATRLEALAAELAAAHGVRAEAWPCDLGQAADVDALVARLKAAPRVDLLVNNAGFGTQGALAKADPVGQEQMIMVHVMAATRLSQAVLPGMVARQRGGILNVSSVASWIATQGNVNYCATKAYLRTFSLALAAECAGRGITVQALCPGFTHTEFHQRLGFDKGGVPAWLWLPASRVIRESLDALAAGGPVVVVPGKRYKLMVFLLTYASWILRPLQQRHRRDT
jgi:short-subunit dehydrogenase